MNGKPGMRVGLAPVKRGESLDVKVPLKDLTTPKVIVAVHADKGTAGEFDFDMMNKEMSPDRPFFVDGAELAKVVTVRDFGVHGRRRHGVASRPRTSPERPSSSSSSTVQLRPPTRGSSCTSRRTAAPASASACCTSLRARRTDVVVPLDPVPLTPNLLVAVHADNGDPGLFEFDMDDKLNSPDQPFFVDGEEVAIKVPVK